MTTTQTIPKKEKWPRMAFKHESHQCVSCSSLRIIVHYNCDKQKRPNGEPMQMLECKDCEAMWKE